MWGGKNQTAFSLISRFNAKQLETKLPKISSRTTFHVSICETHLVQFIGYSADDGLVSEVEMEPLKIHLPVNPLIAMCLRVREISYIPDIRC